MGQASRCNSKCTVLSGKLCSLLLLTLVVASSVSLPFLPSVKEDEEAVVTTTLLLMMTQRRRLP
jgi:hypothetical protein